jgi:hypothetical protein
LTFLATTYRPFREDHAYLTEIDEPTSQSPLTAYARVFSELCNSALTEDTFILKNMDEHDIFQCEKIVVDPRYFRSNPPYTGQKFEWGRLQIAMKSGTAGDMLLRPLNAICWRSQM